MTPSTSLSSTTTSHRSGHEVRYPIRFEQPFALAARLAAVTPSQSYVLVDDDELLARFGRWTVRTPLSNIDSVSLSGPYQWLKIIGPPRLSVHDRGLTFAGNARNGVCIHFRTPVRGLDPAGFVRHPGLTVTVEQPERFVETLRARLPDAVTGDVDEAVTEIEDESHDELEGYTAAELREIARADGISGVSRLKKQDLIERIEHRENDGA